MSKLAKKIHDFAPMAAAASQAALSAAPLHGKKVLTIAGSAARKCGEVMPLLSRQERPGTLALTRVAEMQCLL